MRIKIKFSGANVSLPINNQHIINSFIHRVLGKDNIYHDAKSNYNISSLQGGKWVKGTDRINFNDGYIIVSSKDNEFLNGLILCTTLKALL